ncbi:MAG: RecX family transcriptional regulator [FCB group bacterium]|nr:RecX family transcriptional regulator [FCB group bacterium]MBL7027613.1 RecX family transcriptional regulator [Candidatus Neomarinimicrobiota bacterium]MBL7121243.1 RecX family transcriptional regulator [Candidatus Neomarinimicrobiota bacterium]
MPKITKITQQKKLSERFNLFVDGKFELGVDGSLIVKYDIKVGDAYTDELKHDLENDDRIEIAYIGLINFIAFRERCEQEVKEWLYKKKYHDLADELIARLTDRNYLNNERFARLFIKDRVKIQGWGPIRLRHELNAKRISKQIIESEIEAIREDFDFNQMAHDLASKKLKNIEKPTYKDKKRLWSQLQRRGFEGPSISFALQGYTFVSDDKPS